MHAADFGEQGGEHVEAHRHAADETDGAAQRLALVADARHGFLEILKDTVTELQQRFAGGRDADTAADPVEDRFAELLLEQKDLPADGRL